MGEYAPQAIWDCYYTIAAGIDSAVMSGIVGDPSHSYGYHRCRNALSSWDYSCQYDADLRGNGDAASALDVKFSDADMKTVTRRLIDAVDAGDPRVQVLREFYGTVDGSTVTGRDIPTGDWITSDDTHLWHVHMSGFREFADNGPAWQGVAAIVLGQEEIELTPEESVWLRDVHAAIYSGGTTMPWDGQSINTMLGAVYGALVRVNEAAPDALPMATTEGDSYTTLVVGTADAPSLVSVVSELVDRVALLDDKTDVLLRRSRAERGREPERQQTAPEWIHDDHDRGPYRDRFDRDRDRDIDRDRRRDEPRRDDDRDPRDTRRERDDKRRGLRDDDRRRL